MKDGWKSVQKQAFRAMLVLLLLEKKEQDTLTLDGFCSITTIQRSLTGRSRSSKGMFLGIPFFEMTHFSARAVARTCSTDI